MECFLGPESIGNVSAAFVLLGKVVRHFDFEENWLIPNAANKDHTWSVLYSMLGRCQPFFELVSGFFGASAGRTDANGTSPEGKVLNVEC